MVGIAMKVRIDLLIAAMILIALSLAIVPRADGQAALPEAPGRDTMLLVCTQCHSLGKMYVAELTAKDWQFIVSDMIGRGAPVHQEDIADLTKYLQDNFAIDRKK